MKTFTISTFMLIIVLMACESSQPDQPRFRSSSVNLEDPITGSLSPVWFKVTLEDYGGNLIDLRSPEIFLKGTIEDAVNIEFVSPQFDEEVQKLDKLTPIYIFSDSIKTTVKAFRKLEGMGFKAVCWLDCGYDEFIGSDKLN